MSRELDIGSKRFTVVSVVDDPGAGGACHKYRVESVQQKPGDPVAVFGFVDFQNGPVKERGVNGCHQEDLLVIVIDRLRCFQKGEFRCRENAVALTKIEEAIMWLNARTNRRMNQGVEGTSVQHQE